MTPIAVPMQIISDYVQASRSVVFFTGTDTAGRLRTLPLERLLGSGQRGRRIRALWRGPCAPEHTPPSRWPPASAS